MPLGSTAAPPAEDWQEQLRNVITRADDLLDLLGLSPIDVGYSPDACADFPLKVPRSFAMRMEPGNPNDPLLLQVLANTRELLDVPGYSSDPVGEAGPSNPRPGIIHKYHGRALLIVAGGCAVNCRYCFRRHFPYGENQNSRLQWRDALQYIRGDSSIEEVILSGGDPLVATDEQLRQLVELIAAIPHVKRLRIHSRLPIVIPARITEPLLDAITHSRLQTVMVTHCNHSREINASVGDALAALRRRHITILNQAVLLAQINDDVTTQVELGNTLFAHGVLPYYLHMLDKVAGAAHFDVSERRGLELMEGISARLPGYLVPRLVREIAGNTAKVTVASTGSIAPGSSPT